MFHLKGSIFILMLSIIVMTGGTASGQCDVNDGNNDEACAATISVAETVTGVVCPDDPFDFYMLEIPVDADVSGDIAFTSTQPSTVIRLYENVTKSRIIDDVFTNDNTKSYNIPIATGTLIPGTYYFRLSFWSAAAYDHEYTLTLNLEMELPPDTGRSNKTPYDMPLITIMQTPPMLLGIATSTWPSGNGHADKARRARTHGPGVSMLEISSTDLFDNVLSWTEHHESANPMSSGWDETHYLSPSGRYAGFNNLLVGPRDLLYFGISLDAFRKITYAYDVDDGQMWRTGQKKNARLDMFGNYYFLFHNGYSSRLYSYDTSGEERWISQIPELGASVKLGVVGKNIYVNGGYQTLPDQGGIAVYITAFSTTGDVSWTAGPFDHEVQGMAEDSSGNLYFRDNKENLYKVNTNGEIVWSTQMPSHEYSCNDANSKKGPIVGVDGRIWAYTKLWSNETGPVFLPGETQGSTTKYYPLRNGPVYIVTNSDGTNYKYDKFGNDDKTPYFVCYGSNEMLCVAFKDKTVTGFSDWDQEEWTWQRSETENIYDMVMDDNNLIYIAFSAWGIQTMGLGSYIAVIDSTTGQELSFKKVDIPEEWAGVNSELAFGKDGTLIYLNAAGYLKVYGPGLILGPAMTTKPVRVN